MKSKGLAGALLVIVAGLLTCRAAGDDNSRSEFEWSATGLDKWLLGMYSDGLAGWDVEPETRVPHEATGPRLVPGMGLWRAFGKSALLPPADGDLIFDPPLSDVYAGWHADLPAAPELGEIWPVSFDLLTPGGPK